MIRSFIKYLIIFSIPLLILFGAYIYGDPFKVIHKYDLYLSEYVMLNRGYISTSVFLKNDPQYNFDSFIFGSSRSTAFTCKEWVKYLSPGCSAFSYGNWNESIEGILGKVQFIDLKGNKIENAIIVIDTDQTFRKNSRSLSRDHYLISGMDPGRFHMLYFSQSLRNVWLIPASIDYKLFRTRRSYMKGFVGMNPGDIDPVRNDYLPDEEDNILRDSVAYYSGSHDRFYTRPETDTISGIQITPDDLAMIQKINLIFKKHRTNFKIIIGPLYDQIKFNNCDLDVLKEIFGEENVFDFSGINYITGNMYNYKNDVTHFRNRTGSMILRLIYKN